MNTIILFRDYHMCFPLTVPISTQNGVGDFSSFNPMFNVVVRRYYETNEQREKIKKHSASLYIPTIAEHVTYYRILQDPRYRSIISRDEYVATRREIFGSLEDVTVEEMQSVFDFENQNIGPIWAPEYPGICVSSFGDITSLLMTKDLKFRNSSQIFPSCGFRMAYTSFHEKREDSAFLVRMANNVKGSFTETLETIHQHILPITPPHYAVVDMCDTEELLVKIAESYKSFDDIIKCFNDNLVRGKILSFSADGRCIHEKETNDVFEEIVKISVNQNQ